MSDAQGSGDSRRTGRPRIALVLPGGGARSAYQVGVFSAMARWCPAGQPLPFPILCGTSAGAINCAVLATHATNALCAAQELEQVWCNFRIGQVFRAGTGDMLRSGARLLASLLSAGWLPMPRSLLDNTPLRHLLEQRVDFQRVQQALEQGALQALALTATCLADANSVTFVQSGLAIEPWQRAGRRGEAVQLGIDHLMASSAIPLLFPPATIAGHHFSDGAIRQATPLAPALHLGAERVLVIGAGEPPAPVSSAKEQPPALGEMFGFLLEALFMESLQADLERLARINTLVSEHPGGPAATGLRQVEVCVVRPRQSLSAMALNHARAMPFNLRNLLRVLGASGQRGGQLLSYLLFEAAYTRELIALGQQDAEARRAELSQFLGLDCASDQQ